MFPFLEALLILLIRACPTVMQLPEDPRGEASRAGSPRFNREDTNEARDERGPVSFKLKKQNRERKKKERTLETVEIQLLQR